MTSIKEAKYLPNTRPPLFFFLSLVDFARVRDTLKLLYVRDQRKLSRLRVESCVPLLMFDRNMRRV